MGLPPQSVIILKVDVKGIELDVVAVVEKEEFIGGSREHDSLRGGRKKRS